MPSPTDNIEGEMLDAQLRAARRAQVLMAPCWHCYATPAVLAVDVYGYPRATDGGHQQGCPDYVPE
jgi:hypothetical protein